MSETTNVTALWWVLSAAELSRVERLVEERGTCAQDGADLDDWFPAERPGGPKSESGREKSLERAQAACEGCPMLTDCRRAALNRPDRDGIFGGLPGWALEEIRRSRPLERTRNRENYDPMVILGERPRYERLGTGIPRAERDEMHERTLRLIDLVANAGQDELGDAA